MTVLVNFEREYEVETDHLDPKYIDIEGFAIDEVKRFIEDEIYHNQIIPDDFDYKIIMG